MDVQAILEGLLQLRDVADVGEKAKLDWGFVAAFGGGILGTLVVMAPLFRGQGLTIGALRGLNATYANVGFMGIPLCAMVVPR